MNGVATVYHHDRLCRIAGRLGGKSPAELAWKKVSKSPRVVPECERCYYTSVKRRLAPDVAHITPGSLVCNRHDSTRRPFSRGSATSADDSSRHTTFVKGPCILVLSGLSRSQV